MSESPDIFRATPKRGDGVRRMNRLPLVFVFGVFVLVAGVVGYTVIQRSEDAIVTERKESRKADPATSDGVLDDAPSVGLIEPEKIIPEPQSIPTESVKNDNTEPQIGDSNSYSTEWQQYKQQQNQVQQAQLQAAMSALTASPAVGEWSGKSEKLSSLTAGSPVPPSIPQGFDAAGGIERIAAIAQRAAAQQGIEPDQNNAKGKRSWLDSEPNPADYLPSGRRPVASPFEIKTGTVIPSIMIGGINSDLPGQIIAQVRENVWDTATGKYLLIPQGARLIGTYDNQITRGQSRILVAWNRIIYPDGSSLDLGSMPGADQAGYAGFKDKANNHYWKVFGDAMMLSLFSAGIQLSQPQSSVGQGYDSQQVVAGSIGQQLGQSGMQITQKNLNIQPTLEIRPGYKFNVMVTRDMVIRPWQA